VLTQRGPASLGTSGGRRLGRAAAGGLRVANHDGAGLIVGVGNGVDPVLLHQRPRTAV
jgi:hypothetical protein